MVRRYEGTLAPGLRRDPFAQVLSGDQAGARLVLDGRDVNLYRSRRLVPLHSPHRRAPVRSGLHDFGAQPGTEYAARSILGQTKADGRVLDWFSRFVRDQHCQAARRPRPGGIYVPFPLDHLQLDNDGSVRGDPARYGAAQQSTPTMCS